MRSAMQGMARYESRPVAGVEGQAIAFELLEREAFNLQRLEHHRFLRALKQSDGDEVMPLELGLRRQCALPAAARNLRSWPISTATIYR